MSTARPSMWNERTAGLRLFDLEERVLATLSERWPGRVRQVRILPSDDDEIPAIWRKPQHDARLRLPLRFVLTALFDCGCGLTERLFLSLELYEELLRHPGVHSLIAGDCSHEFERHEKMARERHEHGEAG